MVNLKKALSRFYSQEATQVFDFPSAWSSTKLVILSHLAMSLCNIHNPQFMDTSLCGMLICPLVGRQTRAERLLLRYFASGPASGPILSSLPSQLGGMAFGPFPCLWDSRLGFCPVRHQWAIAGEEERDGNFNERVVNLLYWLLCCFLSSLRFPCSPPHSLRSLSLFQAPFIPFHVHWR